MDISKFIIDKYKFQYAASKEKSLAVGYGVDRNYMRCAAASLASICVHNEELELHFHIITDELTGIDIERFRQMAQSFQVNIALYHIDTQKVFAQLPTQSHFPAAIYFRYILPVIIKTGKILYLDADIINLGSLAALCDLDLQKHTIAAASDLEWMVKKRCKILELADGHYFNSGVIFLDVKSWNHTGIFERSVEMLQKNPQRYRYPDQDVLNILLHDKVYYLEQSYNCLDCSAADTKQIILLHFAAQPKPWNIAWSLSKASNDFNRDIYAEYEALTPWKDEPPQLPNNDKVRKIYAQALLAQGQYKAALKWYMKYIKGKLK